jgi:WD40 repeat protein/tetratricopeptide (TPR) repeat protein
VQPVAFSPDGKSLLNADADGTLQWWDLATGRPIGKPTQNRLQVPALALAISPDGRAALTGIRDGTARLWDVVTNQPIGPALVHQSAVAGVAFSPDGKTFLTASHDHTVRLWDADPGQPFGLILDRRDVGRQHFVFSPDGKSIFRAGLTVMRWDKATGQMIWETMNQGGVAAVAVSHDGRRLLTGSYDHTARLLDATTGKPIGPALQHQDDVSMVAFCSDGKTMMTGGQDRTVRLWDALTGTPLGQLSPTPGGVDAGAFSPDGKSFVICEDSGSAYLYDLAKRTPLGQPFPHPGAVNAAAFSPDGKTLLTGCEDGAARLWELKTRRLRTAPLRHQAWVSDVAFSPDGTTILTGSWDKTARLWDAATGMPLGPPIPHPYQLWAVAFSPDGNSFLTGDSLTARLFRKVPEVPDDLERVATWVEVLTGLTLDAEPGTIQVLDNAAWRERREQLEKRGGPPETQGGPRLDPILFGTDPIARGRLLIDQGRWDEAEAAFDEVVCARPYNASSWFARGRFRIARGDPERATADFAWAIRLEPENLELRYSHALSLLAQGDQAGLREACSDMERRVMQRIGAATIYAHDANLVARCCALAPDAVADREAPVRLAEFAVQNAPADRRPNYLHTLGAALYRARRSEESILRLEESIRGRKSLPQDWVFLALAHQQIGHGAEARRWLDQFRTYRANEKPEAFSNELEIRLLRNEAEAVIVYDPVFPADPFAH